MRLAAPRALMKLDGPNPRSFFRHAGIGMKDSADRQSAPGFVSIRHRAIRLGELIGADKKAHMGAQPIMGFIFVN
jgi:hypothetical protein